MTEYHHSANAKPNEYPVPPEEDEKPNYSQRVANYQKEHGCSLCGQNHGSTLVQHCDSCNQPQDQPGYTCRACSLDEADYYVVGPQTHDYGYYITVDENCPFMLSEPIANEWFVCPAEEVEEFETHRAKAFHCIQWAKEFASL